MMFSPYEAQIVDRLREAAREHGEVSDLLKCLASALTIEQGAVSINVDDADRGYIEAVLVAAAFSSYDDQESGRE